MGRWSRALAVPFLGLVAAPARARWLEVGCGTGALTEAILERAAPALVVAADPAPALLAAARTALDGPAVRFIQAGAGSLPRDEAPFDVAVTSLALNFFPDPPLALREMAARTAPGGVVGAVVWDYADGMQMLRAFWDGATALDPGAVPLDEGRRFRLCQPDPLTALFQRTGLEAVRTVPLTIPTRFRDFDDFWLPFTGGAGPGPAYVASLDPAARDALAEHLRKQLPTAADGSIPLLARAWGVRGRRPA